MFSKRDLVFPQSLAALFIVPLVACTNASPSPDVKDQTGADTAGTTGAQSTTSPSTSSGTLTSGSDSSGTTQGTLSTSSNTHVTTSSDSTSTSSSAKELPYGSPCTQDQQCLSGLCSSVEIREVDGSLVSTQRCSRCKTDQECEGSAEEKNYCAPVSEGSVTYLACSKGALGDRCTQDQHCGDTRTCAMVPRDKGFWACSTCQSDSDCTNEPGSRCLVRVDEKELRLYRGCSKPRPNGSLCSVILGEEQGECTAYCVSVPKLGQEMGICGECRSSEDCPSGGTCKPPQVLESQRRELVPSTCSSWD